MFPERSYWNCAFTTNFDRFFIFFVKWTKYLEDLSFFFFFCPRLVFFCLTKIFSQNIKNIIASQISLKKQLFDSFLYSDILARQLQSKNKFQIITHTTHVSTENILRILPLLFIVCTKFKTMWKTMLNKLKCKSCVSFCKSKKIMHISAFTTSHPMNATSDFWISILHLCSNSGGKNHNF